MPCTGDGQCLVQCSCECYDEIPNPLYGMCGCEYDCECYNEFDYVWREECTCGHRTHEGYCPSECCTLVECKFYAHCGARCPQWYVSANFGTCGSCAVVLGPHQTPGQVGECCVCYEEKPLLVLKCTHTLCKDCWWKIAFSRCELVEPEPGPRCPLCRNANTWGNS